MERPMPNFVIIRLHPVDPTYYYYYYYYYYYRGYLHRLSQETFH